MNKERLRLHENFCRSCTPTTWCPAAQALLASMSGDLLTEEIKLMRLEIQRIRAVKDEAVEQKEQFLRSISDYKKENDRLKAQLAAMKGKGKRYAE